jgi:hypothetical protein
MTRSHIFGLLCLSNILCPSLSGNILAHIRGKENVAVFSAEIARLGC